MLLHGGDSVKIMYISGSIANTTRNGYSQKGLKTMDLKNGQKNETDTQKKRKRADRRGFYAALAVCVLAIAIAAWSTYDTMMDFLEPTSVTETKDPSDAGKEISKPAADDPEPSVTEGHGHATAPIVGTEAEPEETPEVPVTAPAEEPVEEPAAVPVEEEPATPAASYVESVQYSCPVKSGELLAPYSQAPVYSETMRDYRMHTGADYKAERGETVHAAANGIVKSTHTDMLLGNMIVIEHGSAVLSYCGLGETFLVKPGEVVEKGQDIGSITAAPFESAIEPHLHLEAEQHGKKIDPEVLFK